MSDIDDRNLGTKVLTMRIIVGALVMGVVTFAAIACFHVYGQQTADAQTEKGSILSFVSLGVFTSGAVASFLVPALVFRHTLAQIAAGTWTAPKGQDPKDFEDDAGKLLVARQTALIIGLALLEGPAFFACVAFRSEEH